MRTLKTIAYFSAAVQFVAQDNRNEIANFRLPITDYRSSSGRGVVKGKERMQKYLPSTMADEA